MADELFKLKEVKVTNPENFSKELVEFFFRIPYTSCGTRDLQEYIVHLLNKYAEYNSDSQKNNWKKFINASDSELESLFHVTKRYLRTIKDNVEVKFGTYKYTDSNLLNELMNLPKRNFEIKSDKRVHLVIDNGVVRDHLESYLHEICGTVFDYKNNPSMVDIEANLFIECLERLMDSVCNEKNTDSKIIELNATLKKMKRDEFIGKLVDFGKVAGNIAEKSINIAANLSPASATVSTLFNFIKAAIENK